MKKLATLFLLLSASAGAENILFVGDSTVSYLENPYTGKPVLDALIDSGNDVRLWRANEIACNGFPGGFLTKIESSENCLSDLYEWADTVVLLSGSHDLMVRNTSAEDRSAVANRIREQVGDRNFVWFDTSQLLGEAWSCCRHVDLVHLSTKGYERLFEKLGL